MILRWGIAFCGFPVLLVCTAYQTNHFVRVLLVSSSAKSRAFDAEIWRHPVPTERGHTTRSETVDELLTTHWFVGWTQQQVEALLGPADPLPDTVQGGNFTLVYYLGTDRSIMPLGREWLGFVVDDQGIVKHAQTWAD